ncbi:MAG: Biotin carboxyl carrier protein of acetyl-CoA carboxylase [Firmicutes bacterium ADurb.Bin182]|nr:MAG: Biotin carboxyl carrier protein of acetyl-CoA carboxylase [Firmicutes bacterium ADurb.Bin182]
MNIEDIEKLACIVQKYNLSRLDVSDGDIKLRLESSLCGAETEQRTVAPSPAGQVNIPVIKDPGIDFNDIKEIKSPMVGVFYAAPSPDSAPFATIGSNIKKGDVLCIIEAMKLMNEICAEIEGQIVDVCVSNGDVVEFGQTLFKVI